MTAFVDTKILARHLTGDPPAMAKRATAYLVASVETAGVGTIASFDKAIDRVTTVTRMEP